MENKKTKLTISGSPKKSFKNFQSSKNQGKKTVVIDRHVKKPFGKGTGGNYKTSSSNFKKGSFSKSNFAPKFPPSTVSDFEKENLLNKEQPKNSKEMEIKKEKIN